MGSPDRSLSFLVSIQDLVMLQSMINFGKGGNSPKFPTNLRPLKNSVPGVLSGNTLPGPRLFAVSGKRAPGTPGGVLLQQVWQRRLEATARGTARPVEKTRREPPPPVRWTLRVYFVNLLLLGYWFFRVWLQNRL